MSQWIEVQGNAVLVDADSYNETRKHANYNAMMQCDTYNNAYWRGFITAALIFSAGWFVLVALAWGVC